MSYASVSLALPSFHLPCVPASVPAVPYLDPLPPCSTFTFCAMTTTAATARLNEIDGALAHDLNEATDYRHGAWCRRSVRQISIWIEIEGQNFQRIWDLEGPASKNIIHFWVSQIIWDS
ncbi:hypothetical protein C8R45DRAFT_931674 [Mycena sanguinolenta]|nr:hypothetical protein C8R45DRAFT_931674 [Mycena sanguinolenta]